MSQITNAFKEADIVALAQSGNVKQHALARLTDQQCMEDLRRHLWETRRALTLASEELKYCAERMNNRKETFLIHQSCDRVLYGDPE